MIIINTEFFCPCKGKENGVVIRNFFKKETYKNFTCSPDSFPQAEE